jgi:MOSC domain-containing protein YiiM
MTTGKVLQLYMTIHDFMRSGNRTVCDSIDCDDEGIIGDINYEIDPKNKILLVSKKSYDMIEEAEIALEKGMLMENIYVDIDLYHLKEGSIIQIGQSMFTIDEPCHSYGYLYQFAPEIPGLLQNNRGVFISPVDYGRIELSDEVKIIEEA